MREFWLNYDHQTGQWIVQETPIKVIRPGSEVIHVREVINEKPVEKDDCQFLFFKPSGKYYAEGMG